MPVRTLFARGWQILETAILASLVAGAVIGGLARLAMTALTLGGGRSNDFAPLTFTLPGTLTIVTLAIVGGFPLALALVAGWRYLPGAGWVKALSAGGATLIFPGLLALTDSSFKLNPVNLNLGLALFALLYFGYGCLAGAVIHYRHTRAATPTRAAAGAGRWRAILLPAALVLVIGLYLWADRIAFGR